MFAIEPAQQPGSAERDLDALGGNLYADRDSTDEGVHIICRQIIPGRGELGRAVNETLLPRCVRHFVAKELMNLAGVGEPLPDVAHDERLQCHGWNTLAAD